MPPDAMALIRRAKEELKQLKKPDPDAPPSPALKPLLLADVPSAPPAIASLPQSVQYIPDFLTPADESALLLHILDVSNKKPWSDGNGRRTQNWGGSPNEREVAEPLPDWLVALTKALVASGAWPATEDPPNHVIINDYEGCDFVSKDHSHTGLTPHTDGPLYAPRVATLSLFSDIVMELHRPEDAAVLCGESTRLARLLLRRRSLNVLSGNAYELFHGFPAAESDLIDGSEANFAAAIGAGYVGSRVSRKRRVSVVFVCKR